MESRYFGVRFFGQVCMEQNSHSHSHSHQHHIPHMLGSREKGSKLTIYVSLLRKGQRGLCVLK